MLATPLPGDVRLMNATAALFAAGAVRIEGDVARNSVHTIRANAMPRLAGSFFTIDLAVAKAAFESVPWVRRAEVRRVFPNRLVVRLEEHRPAALWGLDGGGDQLVNTFGEVFQANPGDVEDDDLPTLAGPPGSAPRMLALYTKLAPAFERLELSVATLELSARSSWRAMLDDGAVVELGRAGADEDDGTVVERTRRYVATVGEVARRYDREPVYADLRHRDGYALRLRGVTTNTKPEKSVGSRN